MKQFSTRKLSTRPQSAQAEIARLNRKIARLQAQLERQEVPNLRGRRQPVPDSSPADHWPDTPDLFRALIHNLDVGVLLQGLRAEILLCNPTALNLLGLTESELLGKSSFDPDWNLIHEDGSPFPGSTTPVPQVLATGQPVRNVIVGVTNRQTGQRVWLLVNATPQHDDGGLIRQVICTFTDITTRKQSEEALRESESRFQAILDNSPLSIFVKDRQGRYLNFNRQCELTTGFSKHQAYGKTDYELVPAEFAAQWLEHDRAVLETGQAMEWEEVAYNRAGLHYEVTTKFPLFDSTGAPYAVVGISLDVTERKRMEASLAAEKERLDVIFASIVDSVITTDSAGRILMMNQTAQALTGWTEAQATGLPLSQVFRVVLADDDRAAPCPVEQVLAAGEPVEFSKMLALYTLLARDGARRLIAGTASPIRNPRGEISGIVLVWRDVTAKQRMTEELLKAGKLESLGLLAGGLAHDFNNILTAIAGNISLARLLAEEDARPELLTFLDEAERASLGAKELTGQLLTFARGGAPVKQTASLSQIIRASAQFVLHGSKVQSIFELSAGLWPAEVDRSQFSQVIQNLVLNAVQAMPGGGQVRVLAENCLLDAAQALDKGGLTPGPYLRIAIRDQGQGIAPQNLSRIFDPYFTTKTGGTGLGLAICYSIMKQHEGHIEVLSEAGGGSTFCLYLPANPVGPLEQPPASPPESEALLPGQGHILIMDDEPGIRKVLANQLVRLGYTVAQAAEGCQALELYRQARAQGRPFDLVIMDLTIPGGMGGQETMQRLLQFDPEVKAIVSSGYANDPVMANYRDFGFAGLVAKPYRLAELVAAIKTTLA